jgi:hypothetical protein
MFQLIQRLSQDVGIAEPCVTIISFAIDMLQCVTHDKVADRLDKVLIHAITTSNVYDYSRKRFECCMRMCSALGCSDCRVHLYNFFVKNEQSSGRKQISILS